MTLGSNISLEIIISLPTTYYRRLIGLDNSIQQVYLNIELCRYTKELVTLVIQSPYLGLVSLNRSNIMCSKLVTINKLELFIEYVKVITRGIRCQETKLFKKDSLIDTISTFNSAFIFKYCAKLLEPSLIYYKLFNNQYLRVKITAPKHLINTRHIDPLNYI